MSETDFNCNKCGLKDTDRMVQCDRCDKWFHFECVGVNSDVANVSWYCPCGLDQPVSLMNTNEFSAGAQGSSSPARQVPARKSTGQINAGQNKGAYKEAQTISNNRGTARFSAGTQGSSSPEIQVCAETQIGEVGPPQIITHSGHEEDAHTSAPNLNFNNYGVGNGTPVATTMSQTTVIQPTNTTTTLPTATNIAQNMQRHFVNSGSNMSSRNLSSQMQLQLQMLEEEKELQRQYLDRKYKILSQNDVAQSSCSFSTSFSSFQPTTSQIAARQVIPKELPNFDGNPEDWPLFISNYKTSTELAGYTDGENLMRLQ